jgi:gamma-glutamylcyclotransferase (GGCT)/AIG2-like uncharacterized protein YtfP
LSHARPAWTIRKLNTQTATWIDGDEMSYYFAYGSNLNKDQMAKRCPRAVAIGPMILPEARLVFRGVADVEYDETGEVHGGLWRITKRCERALDRYEGVAGGLYRKVYIEIELPVKGKRVARRCLLYVMNRESYYPPDYWYAGTIRKGYLDFGLDTTKLREAIRLARQDRLPWKAA